ncbi:NifU family protein [Bradyrhizobium vignae]|nr:NifU family protein [Bradyrhizobium vignae]
MRRTESVAFAAPSNEIRPTLRRDGGDCHLIGIDGSRVMVRLSTARTLL